MAGLRALAVVVCLLTAAEPCELGLDGGRDAARRAGLDFVWLPVADRGVADAAAFLPVLGDLVHRLDRGHHVVAHCRFRIGRASLLAAALLTAHGCDPDRAWKLISAAGGHRVPDTDDQRNWIRQYVLIGRREGRDPRSGARS
ncbi:protein tyrosine phosphatase [Micromonospora citrea]|uniref:Protein tyrosine phosphatase n=1 Tax=Micromonospora citrea TaxID=47855 RepID=A0A1C6VWK5_9ACTN|nr:hypothetical protein [Micromonospora citrea]SCL70270.1 protein tyrosine phosphatase [Micromonospora citrea]